MRKVNFTRHPNPAQHMGDTFEIGSHVDVHVVKFTLDGWQPTGAMFRGRLRPMPVSGRYTDSDYFNVQPSEEQVVTFAHENFFYPHLLPKEPQCLVEEVAMIAYVVTEAAAELDVDHLANVPLRQSDDEIALREMAAISHAATAASLAQFVLGAETSP